MTIGPAKTVLSMAGIALVTALVFAGTLGHGFVWDDDQNLVDNPHYRGFGRAQVAWMLRLVPADHPGRDDQWIPLSWASLALDHLLWDMNPAGYHLTAVLLHATNTTLFYGVAVLLLSLATPAAPPVTVRRGAAVAALFFGVHPLRVESVAWVGERSDLLSAGFLLIAVRSYLEACHSGGRRRWWLAGSIVAFVLALASNAIVMTLPLLLLLLDAYPLRRLRGAWRARIMEKVPYLVFAVAAGAFTLAAGTNTGRLDPLAALESGDRIAITFWALARYVRTTILPMDLSPLYEAPLRVDVWAPAYVASAVSVAGVTAVFVLLRRRWPGGLAVWSAWLLLLAPVAGLVRAGPQQAADRYTYLPSLAAAVLLGGAVVTLFQARAGRRVTPRYMRSIVTAVAVWLATLGALTWDQAHHWRDHVTLWTRAVSVDPHCGLCQGNLGEALRGAGQLDAAVSHFRSAIALRPDEGHFWRGFGFALLGSGRPAEAVGILGEATARRPTDPDVRNALGLALAMTGRLEESVGHFEAAVRLAPGRPDLLVTLASAFGTIGRTEEARRLAERVLVLKPGDGLATRVLRGLPPPR